MGLLLCVLVVVVAFFDASLLLVGVMCVPSSPPPCESIKVKIDAMILGSFLFDFHGFLVNQSSVKKVMVNHWWKEEC